MTTIMTTMQLCMAGMCQFSIYIEIIIQQMFVSKSPQKTAAITSRHNMVSTALSLIIPVLQLPAQLASVTFSLVVISPIKSQHSMTETHGIHRALKVHAVQPVVLTTASSLIYL